MKFALNEDVEKIISPDGNKLEFHRIADGDWMLVWRGGRNIFCELATLTQDEWEIVWKMLTER